MLNIKYKAFALALILSATSVAGQPNDSARQFMLLNNYDLPEYNNIWERFRNGFSLNYEEDDKVRYYEQFYTKNPAYFNKLINNARPYLYYILTQTEKNGMPSEVALIPAVESSFNPKAKNPLDAYAGMWQFVPTTGEQFNLQQTNKFDDRQNIIKSTLAAMQHLIYLHNMFKQWDVAIGAYNWGEGNMYRAIIKSHQPLGKVNYKKLPLRKITADYVPKLVALANIIKNPQKFGVTLTPINNQPVFALTKLAKPTNISAIYQVADVDANTFNKLNPQFKRNDYTLQAREQIVLPLKNQNIYYANASNHNLPDRLPNSNYNTDSNIINVSNSTILNSPDMTASDDMMIQDDNNENYNADEFPATDELMDAVYRTEEHKTSNTTYTPQAEHRQEKNASFSNKTNKTKQLSNNEISIDNDPIKDIINQISLEDTNKNNETLTNKRKKVLIVEKNLVKVSKLITKHNRYKKQSPLIKVSTISDDN